MSSLVDVVAHTGNIVYVAAGTQAAGMLFRSQILLRILLLVGSGLYLTYYAWAADSPLWEAMAATSAIALANVYGLSQILLSRSTRIIPADQLPLYRMFDGLEPGDFRSLMRFGEARTLAHDEVLTVKGEVPEKLFYVIEGAVAIEKDPATRFNIAPPHFIGEVSLVLGTPASATVCVEAGARLIEWPRRNLIRQMNRRNRLKLAIEALIARDMARKVAIGAGTLDASDQQSTALGHALVPPHQAAHGDGEPSPAQPVAG